MQDGQHGPAVVQEPDVVLLVENLRRRHIKRRPRLFVVCLLIFFRLPLKRSGHNTSTRWTTWRRLTCRQLFPASDVMNMPALAEDNSVPVFPAERHAVSHPRMGGVGGSGGGYAVKRWWGGRRHVCDVQLSLSEQSVSHIHMWTLIILERVLQ